MDRSVFLEECNRHRCRGSSTRRPCELSRTLPSQDSSDMGTRLLPHPTDHRKKSPCYPARSRTWCTAPYPRQRALWAQLRPRPVHHRWSPRLPALPGQRRRPPVSGRRIPGYTDHRPCSGSIPWGSPWKSSQSPLTEPRGQRLPSARWSKPPCHRPAVRLQP